MAAARWTNSTVKRPALSWRSIYRIPEVLGFVLLLGLAAGSRHAADGNHIGVFDPPALRIWTISPETGWAMAGLVAVGFLFAWWARFHLGRLWSGTVTRKQDHHVVDSGPYAIVRHPIYTGLLIAAFATAIDRGTSVALAGAVMLLVAFWIKARLEEQFLRSELGAQAYDAYAHKTAMLIPFVKV